MSEPPSGVFRVLRRWSSFTPKIPSAKETPGGGYFLEWQGKCIAIDPGFNYLDNMQKAGLHPGMVNAIVVTHSHQDHTDDLEPLLMMKAERTERLKELGFGADDPLDLFMSMDASNKYRHLITDHQLDNVVNREETPDLSVRGVRDLPKYSMALQTIPADHVKRASQSRSSPLRFAVSLIFHLRATLPGGGQERLLSIGLTSDTRYNDELVGQLKRCEIVVAHLGSVDLGGLLVSAQLNKGAPNGALLRELRTSNPKPDQEEAFRSLLRLNRSMSVGVDLSNILSSHRSRGDEAESGHLLFNGTFSLFSAILQDPASQMKIGIISEFGQELGSFRHKIAQSINHVLLGHMAGSDGKRIITGDIGLAIRFGSTQQTCAHFTDTRCKQPESCHGEEAKFLLQCTLCHQWVCLECIKEHSIKFYNEGVFYNCDIDWRPQYSPGTPRFHV